MKVIDIKDYNSGDGTLIDVDEAESYKQKHPYGAVSVPYEKLMANYKKVLNKDKSYFIYCTRGIRSKKCVSVLEFYGYDVTLVTHENK